MNAVVLQRAKVGARALIAAGAVVGEGMEIPPRSLAAGVPARVRKELEGESLRWVSHSAGHYVELSRDYLAQGIGRVRGPEPARSTTDDE
jgi:carbonic anhydrase/acetyltransferase-like protein (isoleucine patch superfamily)